MVSKLPSIFPFLSYYYVSTTCLLLCRVKKQGRIHGSISRVRVGRGSIVVGQGPSQNQNYGSFILSDFYDLIEYQRPLLLSYIESQTERIVI